MRFLFSLLLLSLLSLVSAKSFHPHGHVSDWSRGARVKADTSVPVLMAVKYDAAGVQSLHRFVEAASDPRSPVYGKWATKQQVDDMVFDNQALSATLQWLRVHGAKKMSVHGMHVRATLKAGVLEKELKTEIHHYSARRDTRRRIARASVYHMPQELAQHVDFVGYVNYFPATKSRLVIRSHDVRRAKSRKAAADGTVTPALLNQVYGITSNTVSNSKVSHGCFEDGQDLDQADLTAFQSQYGLPQQNVTTIVGPNDPTQCGDPNNCIEALLDFEYMMAVAQGAATTFWAMDPNDPHPFMDWLVNMTSDPNAPIVNSVSYGEVEQQVPSDVTARFNIAIQQINARGISVIVSSGDDGVANFPARTDSTQCGFFPSYPASSPYVTAVGATQGPESGSAEVACTEPTGGVITSGGGFSTVWAQPSYQQAAVTAFLNSAGSNLPPTSQFNSSGRGYPDIALLGYNYEMVVDSQTIPVSGTSASAPVFGGIISLITNARLNAGKSTLGFLNPALYQFAASNSGVFNDITSGANNCCAENSPQTCCQYGFTAQSGWDPVTGLGSVNFQQLLTAFMALP